jgi:hypothetical protein
MLKMMMNFFGKINSCSQWEDPSMHSRRFAYFLFNFEEEGFFSFFPSSQCVPMRFPNMSPQFMMGVVSPCWKWQHSILKIKISCSQWKGSTCTPRGFLFFILFFGFGWEVGAWGLFFNSQHVQIKFPKVPQGVPHSTSILSYIVWP